MNYDIIACGATALNRAVESYYTKLSNSIIKTKKNDIRTNEKFIFDLSALIWSNYSK